MQSQSITLDGELIGVETAEPLVRAVIISLFTWRRAEPDDVLPGSQRFGWWGDAYAEILGDRIGSRLWLLSRSPITPVVLSDAKQYATESLLWMLEDEVLRGIEVVVERIGLDAVGMVITFTRNDGTQGVLRFGDLWSFLT